MEKIQQDQNIEIDRLERINTRLAVENQNLANEIERLSFLLQKKKELEKIGFVSIDIDYLLALLYFERFYMKQSRARIVYQGSKFVRVVPDYELDFKKTESKNNSNSFDSIV